MRPSRSVRMTPRVTMIATLALLTIAPPGCSTPGKVDVSKLGPPPSVASLAGAHNQRVEPIRTLWARISVRAKGTYSDGESYEEQGEGHLQLLKPHDISLTIGKLGETYFAFGANESSYWSFDLSSDEHKSGLIGQLSLATREKAAAIGLPVHPAELISLSGLMPVDLAGAGGTRWADDGRSVGVSVPSRWGSFTLWIDPGSNLVVRSQAFDRAGALIATAELTRYKDMTLDDHAPVLVPGKIEITTPDDNGYVRIELSEPSAKAIRSIVFDPRKLARAYRVEELLDLDSVDDRADPGPDQADDQPDDQSGKETVDDARQASGAEGRP